MASNVLYRGFLKLVVFAREYTEAQVTGADINKGIRAVNCGVFLKEEINEGHGLRAVFHSLFLYDGFLFLLSLWVRSESESREGTVILQKHNANALDKSYDKNEKELKWKQ